MINGVPHEYNFATGQVAPVAGQPLAFDLGSNTAQNNLMNSQTKMLDAQYNDTYGGLISPSGYQAIGAGIGAANLAMNLGMYSTNKKAAKAQTNYYNTQSANAAEQLAMKKASTAALGKAFA